MAKKAKKAKAAKAAKRKTWPNVGDSARVLRSAARGRETGIIRALHKGNAIIEADDGTTFSADWGTYEPVTGTLPDDTDISVDVTEAKMVEPVIGQAGPVLAAGPNPQFAGLTLPSARTRDAEQ